jgi:very-short-patch-repair endonuclease
MSCFRQEHLRIEQLCSGQYACAILQGVHRGSPLPLMGRGWGWGEGWGNGERSCAPSPQASDSRRDEVVEGAAQVRHHGYHFRRQAPIASYIVDFACLSQKVIIEVDGVQHEEPKARAADAARDADLAWRSFNVLRFRNSDVSESLEGVMLEVLAALGAVEKPEWNEE